MSQISPPLRILLAGSVLFLAAWFVLLRPGGAEVEPNAVAPDAASATGQPAGTDPAAATTGTAPAAATAPGTAAGAAPAPTAPAVEVKGKAALMETGLPADVAGRIDKKVVVLAFLNRKAVEDRRVAGSMRKVYGHGGKVWTKNVQIDKVSRYAAITRGADVQQSPTVVVVDRDRGVSSLVGFVDSVSINQAVVDALLARGLPVDDSPYLQKLEGTCGDFNSRIRNLREPRNLREFRVYLDQLSSLIDRFYPRVRNLKPPRKYRGVHRQLTKLLNADESLFRKFEEYVVDGQLPVAEVNTEIGKLDARSRKLDLRLAGLGMDDCRQ